MSDKQFEFIEFIGGDGSCIQNAVEIVGVSNFNSGIQAECEYISSVINEKDIEIVDGKTIYVANIPFHKIIIITKNGDMKKIFFNASKYHIDAENEWMDIVGKFN